MTPPTAPFSRAEIRAELERAFEAYAQKVDATSEEEVFADRNGKWSLGEVVEHLRKSNAPVGMGLGLPKFLPKLLYGTAKAASRPYAEVNAHYLAGSKAEAPKAYAPSAKLKAAGKAKLLERWKATNAKLLRQLEKWDENTLDSVRFPHPTLGKLTVREMLLFTLYHQHHHWPKNF